METAIASDRVKKLGVDVSVEWSPWLLYPQMKATVAKRDAYTNKFGGKSHKVAKMERNMKQLFEQEGLEYTLEGMMGPTIDSHRLVEYAHEQGGPVLQNRLVSQVFKAYFSEARDVSDRNVLCAIAEECGIPAARQVLDSDAKLKEVGTAMTEASKQGVTGVPHFFFSYQVGDQQPVRFSVPGAQDASVFEMVFEKLTIKAEQAATASKL